MTAFEEDGLDMTKDRLLKKQKFSSTFVDRKFDELIKMFGGRYCKSDVVVGNPKEEDPRRVRTWIMSPHLPYPHVDDPPIPFPDDYPNNCYAQPMSPRWLKKQGKLGTDCFNKGI